MPKVQLGKSGNFLTLRRVVLMELFISSNQGYITMLSANFVEKTLER